MSSCLAIELCIPPDWERIEAVRSAVAACFAAVTRDAEVDQALAMVCAELLENALKYGRAQTQGVHLSVAEAKGEVLITVTNEIEPGSPHATMLQAKLGWLRGFGDSAEAYVAAMSEIYARNDEREGGLGLVRIVHEGGCALECDVAQEHVTMRARRAVPLACS